MRYRIVTKYMQNDRVSDIRYSTVTIVHGPQNDRVSDIRYSTVTK